jgi:hypothetical protein
LAGHLDRADQLVSQAEQAELTAARQAQQIAQQTQVATNRGLLRAAAGQQCTAQTPIARPIQRFELTINSNYLTMNFEEYSIEVP